MKILNYIWRFIATAFSFSIFGIGALTIFFTIFPIINILTKNSLKANKYMRQTIQLSWKLFIFIMCKLGLISIKVKNFQNISKIRGKIIVANHPTLIDIVILISYIPQADCVVKSALSNNFFMKHIINKLYILNSLDPEILIEHCSKSLKKGNNLIIFPEGSRTIPNIKSKISRGAGHISFASQKNILPIRIDCQPLGLLKNQKWYNFTNEKLEYNLEIKKEIILKKYLDKNEIPNKQKIVKSLSDEIKKSLGI
jgi:1-acyl-sn-glycerol-3-phosphate acyltransferase